MFFFYVFFFFKQNTAYDMRISGWSSDVGSSDLDDRFDWQANGEARHVGVRLDNGVRLENVYVPAGGEIPDRTENPKFGQKIDFLERMVAWSAQLDKPTILVGDFNVAPLE